MDRSYGACTQLSSLHTRFDPRCISSPLSMRSNESVISNMPTCTRRPFFLHSSTLFPLLHASMNQFTPEQKHEILTHLRSRSSTQSVDSIAALHGVKGGRRTLNLWLSRWDGTPQSLQHDKGAGRPHILSRAQVSRHVRAPILAANRAHRAIHYSSLLSSPLCNRKRAKRYLLEPCVAMGRNC
jgi:hypothetical protein